MMGTGGSLVEEQLDNGLKVLIQPLHTAPLVSAPKVA